MTRTITGIKTVLLLLFFINLNAQSKLPIIEKEPAWVTINAVNYANNKLDNEAEEGLVELAFEQQVSLSHKTTYYKKSFKILSEAGVQNSSEVSVSFDPDYQQLAFHSIRIIRNGKAINKLQLSKIKTVQQEKELDRFIYNGSLTALLFLEDVRKADVIEYSYSIKGINPVFQGKYADEFITQFSVPIYQLYYKLISPNDRPISIRNSLTQASPVFSSSAAATTYEWRLSNIPALHVEDNTPSWFDPYPAIMVSEYKSWKEVSDWARSLFRFDQPLAPELQKKVDEIKAAFSSTEGRILAALRFVQDDIRYLGIEMGQGSHKPNSPYKVLMQRFGDCKDKSYLLCTILKAMGVESDPVLINTGYKRSIKNGLPAAGAFDHTTVRVKYNNTFYWFDPTISYQRGPLHSISYPDYQAGLVITDTTTGLTAIPFRQSGYVKVKEVFNVPDMLGEASLIVTTRYMGSYADDVRNYFKGNSIFEMQKTYLDFYKEYFDQIFKDSLWYTDDEQTGIFTTVEQYKIQDFWGNGTSHKKASFEPYFINSVLKKPNELERTMPFSLKYPAHYEEDIEVNLPEPWNIEKFSEDVACSGFKLSYQYNCSGRRLELNYRFENLKDHITAEETGVFCRSLDKAYESLAYDLTLNTVEESSVASSAGLSGGFTPLYIILGICVFITAMVKRK